MNISEKFKNQKVLATASVQLFISTPQLDKWFKSSTGTLCFLKDFSRKNYYFYRLYSLMQGKLWEQEIVSPFVYSKLSYVFHYLAVDRFNYGFRFICEDEAERFFSVINKFSTCTEASAYQQTSGSFVKSILNSSRSQPCVSATPLGSIATAAAAVATVTVMANSNHSSSTNTLTNWSSSGSTTGSTIKAVAKFVCSPDSSSSNDTPRRSRKPTHSIERKRKIDKRDISCPFRCSCSDLHLQKAEPSNDLNPDAEKLLTSTNSCNQNHYEKTEKISQGKNLSQRARKEINLFLKRRLSSSSSQRAPSVQSIPSTASPELLVKTKDTGKKTSPISNASSASTTCSLSLSPNLGKSQLVTEKPVVMREKKKNAQQQDLSTSTCTMKDGDMELIKEILAKYSVTLDKTFIKSLRSYICSKYSDVNAFNKALDMDEDLKQFIAFVADYSNGLNESNHILNIKSPEASGNFISFPNQRFETTWKTPTNCANNYMNTPSTPTRNSNKNYSNRYSYCSSYQLITPVSSNANKTKPPSENKTPVLNSNKITKSASKTPPSHHDKLRQKLFDSKNSTPNLIDNAPPKPPRRISLLNFN